MDQGSVCGPSERGYTAALLSAAIAANFGHFPVAIEPIVAPPNLLADASFPLFATSAARSAAFEWERQSAEIDRQLAWLYKLELSARPFETYRRLVTLRF
jgi:hypothetical protein